MEIYPLDEVFSMTTITAGSFINMNCDVDYLIAHIFSYLIAGLND
jgi:hypothetical protein